MSGSGGQERDELERLAYESNEREKALEARAERAEQALQAVVDAADSKQRAWDSGAHSSIQMWIPSDEAVELCRAVLAGSPDSEEKP